MKLIVLRDQVSKGMMSKKINFSILAKVEVSDAERENIQKYKLGDTLLFTNMADRGTGLLGAMSRKAMAVEFSINDLINGKKIESESITDILDLQEVIIEVSKNFKQILEAATTFGSETVIEL